MDQDWFWLNFGQRKAKLTALQKLVTNKEKKAGVSKTPLSKCNKLKLKCKKRKVVKRKSVVISSPKIKALKRNDRLHFVVKHSPTHTENSLLKEIKIAQKRLHSETEVVETEKSFCPRRVLFRPSDIPPMLQLSRMVMKSLFISGQNKEVDHHRWSVGQMLWGKVGSYPFWPCMVSRDPFCKLFMKEVGSYKTTRSFHVQFFGANAERSWIKEASLLEFEGRAKFLDIVQFGLKNPESSSRSPDEFRISSTWFPAWSLAVAEAETAFKLNLEARIHRYTFQYMIVKGQAQKPIDELLKMVASKLKGQVQAKNKLSVNDIDDNINNYYNEIFSMRNERTWNDSDENYSSDESMSATTMRPGKRRMKVAVRKGLLDVFLAKHMQFVQIEHPDWKKSWIVEHLTQQWSLMSEQQRSRYTTRNTKYGFEGTKKLKKEVSITNDDIDEVDPQKLDLQIMKMSLKYSFVNAGKLCLVCEGQGSNLACCKGRCGRYYHPLCLENGGSNGHMCPECSSGSNFCFACKKPASDAVQCSGDCLKFYHEVCMNATAKNEASFVCQLHTCATCAVDDHPGATKGPFLECMECPTAYHASDFCVGVGSKLFGNGLVVCASHFIPNKRNSQHSRVNVKHCLECGKADGSLLLCQKCPAVYHEDCSDQVLKEVLGLRGPGLLPADSKTWLCPHCLSGRRPLCGEIVWVKYGVYRWWPSEICHPQHVPRKVQKRKHQIGEFPVRFFGSHDFAWVHLGRVISFDRGTSSFRDSLTSSGDTTFKQAVKEAIVATEFSAHVRRTV